MCIRDRGMGGMGGTPPDDSMGGTLPGGGMGGGPMG